MRILTIFCLLVVPLDGAAKKTPLTAVAPAAKDSLGGGPRHAPPPPVHYGDCPFVCSKFPEKSCPAGVVPRCEATFCTNVYKQGREYGSVADGVEMPPGSSRVTCADARSLGWQFGPWYDAISPHAKGISNLGASCYINTFLQVLFHTPLFAGYINEMHEWLELVHANGDLMAQIESDGDAKLDFDMYSDVVALYVQMHDTAPFVHPVTRERYSPLLNPYNLIFRSWNGHRRGEQDDSGQKFGLFLGALQGRSQLFAIAGLAGIPYPAHHSAESLFSIYFTQNSQCEACGNVYSKPLQVLPVYFLNFPEEIIDIYKAGYIRKREIKQNPRTTIQAMVDVTFLNNIQTENPMECDDPRHELGEGGKIPRFYKRQFIYLTDPSPPILVFGIARTVSINDSDRERIPSIAMADEYFGNVVHRLDWHEMEETNPARATANQTVVRATVDFPDELALADLPRMQATGVYKLRGIGIHTGDHKGGHYVAAFYDDATGQWLLGNDGSVTPTTLGAIRTNRYNTISFLVYEMIGHRGPRDDAAAVVAAAGGHPGGVPPLPLTPHTDGGDDGVARDGVGFGAGDSSRPITVVASGGGSKPVSLSLAPSVSDNLFKNPSSLVKKLIRLTDPRLSHLNAISQLLYHTRFTADFMREARGKLPRRPDDKVKKTMDNIDFFIRLYERFVGSKTAKSAFNMSELSPFLSPMVIKPEHLFTKRQVDAVALFGYYNEIAGLLAINDWGELVKPILSCGPTTLGTPASAEFRLLLCVFVDSDRSGKYPIPVVAGSPADREHQLSGAMILEDSGEYAAVFTLDGHRWIYAKDQDIRESGSGFSIGDYLKDNRKKIQLLIFELPLLPSPPAK